jgi:hypothetical protein
MKIRMILSSSVVGFFLSCSSTTEPVFLNQIPPLIKSKNLEQKFNLVKWEIYKNNMYDTLGLLKSSQRISFLKADLGISDKYVEVKTSYLDEDTLETIYIFPSFKDDHTDFEAHLKLMAYGASFKGEVLKYLQVEDRGFLTFSDSISKVNEAKLIDYIQANKKEVNPWLVEYATYKGFIK